MAYGVVHQFAGGIEEQYQATVAAVHPSDGTLMPRMQEGVEGGFTAPPEETGFEAREQHSA